MPLTLVPSIWTGDSPDPPAGIAIQYRVQGLPDGHSALISQKANTNPIRWEVFHKRSPDESGEWQGDYISTEEALAALSTNIGRACD